MTLVSTWPVRVKGTMRRPSIRTSARFEPRPVLHPSATSVSGERHPLPGDPSLAPAEPEHYERTKSPIQPPWKTLAYESAARGSCDAREGAARHVKVTLRPVDSHLRGAMIDLFC